MKGYSHAMNCESIPDMIEPCDLFWDEYHWVGEPDEFLTIAGLSFAWLTKRYQTRCVTLATDIEAIEGGYLQSTFEFSLN